MKSTFFLFLFPMLCRAQIIELKESYGAYGHDDVLSQNDEDYRWLYEILIPENLRTSSPNEAFKSFRVHLKDSYKTFPRPADLQAKNLNSSSKIEGKITYAGIVKKRYIYDVLRTPTQKLILNVRIFLKNPNSKDAFDFKIKLQQAQDIWNAGRVQTDFDYAFKFDLVNDESQAHYAVNVLDSTRGPYDTNWSRDWSGIAIAHEVGHMLGLGDEYQTISGKSDCLVSSLMCSSWTGSLMRQHYYFVLRRLMK